MSCAVDDDSLYLIINPLKEERNEENASVQPTSNGWIHGGFSLSIGLWQTLPNQQQEIILRLDH